MHIFLTSSHLGKDIRSVRDGTTAHEVTSSIMERINTFLQRRSVVVTTCEETASDDAARIVARSHADLFVSLQCHGERSAAVGSAVFCQPSSHASLILAKCVMRHMVYHVNVISRGVKWSIPGEDEAQILAYIPIPAIYINLGFITNAHDAWLLAQRQEEYARSISYGILEYKTYHNA